MSQRVRIKNIRKVKHVVADLQNMDGSFELVGFPIEHILKTVKAKSFDVVNFQEAFEVLAKLSR
jgi:TnpA family transposase